ncbi:ketol-acid reductoisomerase [Nitriliruptoraceae bacterium ZYF776]|nr:ketol-acid reductoisomerase [Profundirhabdus halotolerans]
MAATIFYDQDADLSLIQGRKVAVLGYGSQGHAHALSLRDSGVEVRVGLRPGSGSRQRAEEAGLEVMDTNDAAAWADVVVILAPDTHQADLWNDGVKDAVGPGDALVFGHGFNVHFGYIEAPEGVDVFLVAPKSPGHIVRRMYEQGQGVPGLVAVHQDASGAALELGKSYAAALGLTRAGVLQTTFQEETETDLFGEQAVLCGGTSALVLAGYETLVEAGYQPEVAYFECLHELKLIVDLMYEGGLSWMRHSVSTTAEYGDYVSGPRVITDESKAAMKAILTDIQDGTFARNFVEEIRSGGDEFGRMRAEGRDHLLERVGKDLRKMMPFIDTPSEELE